MKKWQSKATGFYGTDYQLARSVLVDFTLMYNLPLVFDEGSLYKYSENWWQKVDDKELNDAIFSYDSSSYATPSGGKGMIKIEKARRKSIQSIMEIHVKEEEYFLKAPLGINVRNGFITFDQGKPVLVTHSPEHRCRYILDTEWHEGFFEQIYQNFYTKHFLNACFSPKDISLRHQKINLIGQIIAGSLLGFGSVYQTAFFLKGNKANNGKSTLLKVMKAFLPNGSVSHLTLDQLSNEHMVIKLSGVLLNTCSEIGVAAQAGDRLKALISADPVTARSLYRDALSLILRNTFVFACNMLPEFLGGFDEGLKRRFRVIDFDQTITDPSTEEDIINEVCNVKKEEYLAWVVMCANMLVNDKTYIRLEDHKEQLEQWETETDIVRAFFHERIHEEEGLPFVTSKEIYESFADFAKNGGYLPNDTPHKNHFSKRFLTILKTGVHKKTKTGNGYLNLRLKTLSEYNGSYYEKNIIKSDKFSCAQTTYKI